MITTTLAAPHLFDFHLTVTQRSYGRGMASVDRYAGGVYWRALRRGEKPVLASVRPAGQQRGAALQVTVHGEQATQNDLEYACHTFTRVLGLAVDMEGFYRVLEKDPVLYETTRYLWGMRPLRSESLLEALVTAITAQQVSSHIARLIREGLVERYGAPVQAEGETLYAFPTPQAMLTAGKDGLRALKLSARKAEYLQEVCLRTLDGRLAEKRIGEMDDEPAITELMRVRGVGRWTAVVAMLQALGRVDLFPAGDLALRKEVSLLYFKGDPISVEQLTEFARKQWRPYQGLATSYLFAHLRRRRAGIAVPQA